MPLTTSQEDALKQWAELRSLVDEALSTKTAIVKIVHFGKQMERKAGEICH